MLIIVCLVVFSVIGFSTTKTLPKQISFNNSSDNFCIQNPTKCNSSSDCKKCSDSGEIEFDCQQANSKDTQKYCLPTKPTPSNCNTKYGVLEWTGWNTTETSEWECKCQFPNIAGGEGCELNSNVCKDGTFTFNNNVMNCECPENLQLVYTKGDHGDAIPMCVDKGEQEFMMCGNKERCNNFYGDDTQYLRYLTQNDIENKDGGSYLNTIVEEGEILYDGPKRNPKKNTYYTPDNTNILDLKQAHNICMQRFDDKNARVLLSDSCSCSNIKIKDKCIGNCSWNTDKSTGKSTCDNRTDCSHLDDENSCKNNKQCDWDGNKCNSLPNAKDPVFKCNYSNSCDLGQKKADCIGTPMYPSSCVWSGGEDMTFSGERFTNSPVLSTDNKILYVQDSDKLYAISTDTFSKLATYQFKKRSKWNCFLGVDRVYVVDQSKIVALDSKTLVVKIQGGGHDPIMSQPFYKEGKILFSFTVSYIVVVLDTKLNMINAPGEGLTDFVFGGDVVYGITQIGRLYSFNILTNATAQQQLGTLSKILLDSSRQQLYVSGELDVTKDKKNVKTYNLYMFGSLDLIPYSTGSIDVPYSITDMVISDDNKYICTYDDVSTTIYQILSTSFGLPQSQQIGNKLVFMPVFSPDDSQIIYPGANDDNNYKKIIDFNRKNKLGPDTFLFEKIFKDDIVGRPIYDNKGRLFVSTTGGVYSIPRCYGSGTTIVTSDCQTFDYRRLDGVCRTADYQFPYWKEIYLKNIPDNCYTECLHDKNCVAWNEYDGPNCRLYYMNDDKYSKKNPPSPNWVPGNPIIRGDKSKDPNASCYIKYKI